MADRGSFHIGYAIDPATGKAGADEVVIGSSDHDARRRHRYDRLGKMGLAVERWWRRVWLILTSCSTRRAHDEPVPPFPIQPASFRPWAAEGDAQAAGVSVDEYADKQATVWREGLAANGIGSDRLQALEDAGDVTIYTPGSTAGVPLNIVGSLKSPSLSWDTDAEALRDEIEGTVTSPGARRNHRRSASSREHVLPRT
jgi:hypothetical protein